MLQTIRNTAGTWVVKILFILLIISFGVWGIGDVVQRSMAPSEVMAEVGPIEVTRTEVDREFRRQVERLRPLFGGDLPTEQALQLGLLDQAVNVLVQRALFDLAANDAGLRVGTDTVRRSIADEPAFRDPAGRFDPNLFRRVLSANNLSEEAYVQIMRSEIARGIVAQAVASGAAAPKPLVDALYRWRQEQRVAEMLTLPNSSVGDVATPDDTVLQRYHEDHAVRFTAPEYRGLTVAQLTVDDLAKEIAVSDADLRAAYDERAAEFKVPEQRNITMVVLDDETKAKAVADAAKAGTDLAEAARAQGAEPLPTENVTKDELPEIGEAAFTLPKGTVSEPMKSALGWHVLRVDSVTPGTIKTFEQARGQVLTDVRRDRAADQMFEVSNRLDDLLAGGAPLEEAAQKLGLKLSKIESVDNTGKAPAGTPVEGVTNLPQILQTAFALGQGQTSRLTETRTGDFFAVRADSVTPPKLRPFAEVREQVIASWREEEQAKRAAARAAEIAEKLKAGAAPQTIAQETGATFAVTAPFTRDARSVEGLPADVVRKLFTLKPGEVATGTTGGAQVVARLKEVLPADPAAAGADLAPIRTAVARGVEGDLMAQFTEALRRTHPVVIHRDRLQSLYASN